MTAFEKSGKFVVVSPCETVLVRQVPEDQPLNPDVSHFAGQINEVAV